MIENDKDLYQLPINDWTLLSGLGVMCLRVDVLGRGVAEDERTDISLVGRLILCLTLLVGRGVPLSGRANTLPGRGVFLLEARGKSIISSSDSESS